MTAAEPHVNDKITLTDSTDILCAMDMIYAIVRVLYVLFDDVYDGM
jgi:hypothetical protein